MQNEPSSRKRAASGASQSKKKQPTQPKPLRAERAAARADLIAERAATPLDANAVLVHPGGAHSKKTPETLKKVLYCLEIGMSYKKAAVLAGIHFDTLNEWKKSDPEFSDQCKRARIALEQRMLEKLSAHADENLHAVTWALERICSPKKYGKKVKPISIEMLDKPIDEGAPGKVYRVAVLGPNGKLMNIPSVSDAK